MTSFEIPEACEEVQIRNVIFKACSSWRGKAATFCLSRLFCSSKSLRAAQIFIPQSNRRGAMDAEIFIHVFSASIAPLRSNERAPWPVQSSIFHPRRRARLCRVLLFTPFGPLPNSRVGNAEKVIGSEEFGWRSQAHAG